MAPDTVLHKQILWKNKYNNTRNNLPHCYQDHSINEHLQFKKYFYMKYNTFKRYNEKSCHQFNTVE